jgi:hypothetical protein
MKKILLAESENVMPIAFDGLGVKNRSIPMIGTSATGMAMLLVPCVTLEMAKEVARDNIDVILCGLHFDDSRMFDLLRFVKADPALRAIPFLCIKTLKGKVEPTFDESIRIATKALGAVGFFDLATKIDKVGRDHAMSEIAGYIENIVINSERFPLC